MLLFFIFRELLIQHGFHIVITRTGHEDSAVFKTHPVGTRIGIVARNREFPRLQSRSLIVWKEAFVVLCTALLTEDLTPHKTCHRLNAASLPDCAFVELHEHRIGRNIARP